MTYCVQVEIPQVILQLIVVLPDGDLRLEPWRKSQPVTEAATVSLANICPLPVACQYPFNQDCVLYVANFNLAACSLTS